jgi:hypothetical protein
MPGSDKPKHMSEISDNRMSYLSINRRIDDD